VYLNIFNIYILTSLIRKSNPFGLESFVQIRVPLDFASNSQNRRFVENSASGWANADLR